MIPRLDDAQQQATLLCIADRMLRASRRAIPHSQDAMCHVDHLKIAEIACLRAVRPPVGQVALDGDGMLGGPTLGKLIDAGSMARDQSGDRTSRMLLVESCEHGCSRIDE